MHDDDLVFVSFKTISLFILLILFVIGSIAAGYKLLCAGLYILAFAVFIASCFCFSHIANWIKDSVCKDNDISKEELE